MAIWMELRCDLQTAGGNCYSAKNNGPMHLADHGRVVLTQAVVALERQGIVMGWKRLRGNRYACPACDKLR